ncbi:MAG TPA: trehalose-phosphatase [Actinomycetes bacterium]
MTDPALGDQLAALVADPLRALVACDYDGTLAPIVADPSTARPAEGAIEALATLSGLVGRVAVVTGRGALDVVRLGGLDRVPGLVVHGLYGDQRWSGGALEEVEPAPGVAAAREEVAALVAAAPDGVRLEDKGRSVAVHTRQAAEPAAELDRWRAALTEIAARHGLRLEAGRFVLELRPSGSDKGAAVSRLARELGATSVLFAGDDIGDLAAFEALHALRSEGASTWAVAARSAEVPEVAAAADLVVEGPVGVVRLLQELAQLLG